MAEASGSTSQDIPEGYKVQQEGQARILLKGNDVFYNEAQVTNRDLSVAVLRMFVPQLQQDLKGKLRKQRFKAMKDLGALAPANQEKVEGVRILEGLAASGLRSIRYGVEVDGVARVDANDLDPAVVEAMRRNIAFNGPEAVAKVHAINSDARLTMLQNLLAYDVVDLDPYGTPAFLLDSAVQAVAEGGLLMVTATDMAVLCGNSGEVCWTKYGSYPLHRPYCHEMALRILLHSIESHANRYKRTITPLLSLSVDFYVRVFVRVHTSAVAVKDSASKLAYVYQSQGCDAWALQRVGQKVQRGNNSVKFMPGAGPPVEKRCEETGAGYIVGGPMWAEPIHDAAFVGGLLAQLEADKGRYAAFSRIRGLLTSVVEELEDVPLYYNLHDVCKTVHSSAPRSDIFKSALLNAGYRVSGSHACPLAIKTDAPPSVVWDVVRCWVKEHPVRAQDPNSYAGRLLAKEPALQADFKHNRDAESKGKAAGTARFVQNPAFWGPKSRHRPEVEHKGKANQQQQQEQQGQQEDQQQEEQQEGHHREDKQADVQVVEQPHEQHKEQNPEAQQAVPGGAANGAQHSGEGDAPGQGHDTQSHKRRRVEEPANA